MSKQKLSPTLTDVLDEHKKDILKGLNCINVGTIQSYDSSNQTATVKISIKTIIKEYEDGSREVRDKPLLLEVPCMVLTGGGASVRMPISEGDFCLVLFNDRDIDNWFVAGDGQVPNTYRLHDISDGFAIVGIYSLQNAISDWIDDQITVYYNADNNIELKTDKINVKSPFVDIGTADFEFICKATKMKDWISGEINSVFNSHVHAATLPVAGSPPIASGNTSPPSSSMSDPVETDIASDAHQVGD